MTDEKHIPVLPDETVSMLMPSASVPCRIVDGTAGFGGHSERILRRNPNAELLCIDRDESALAYARERLAFAGGRVKFMHGTFSRIADFATENGWNRVDGILLDIGVSSPQIDNPERGFSYRFDGPLDMRMDPSHGATAADLLRDASEDELTRIFRNYGELRAARLLAKEIIRRRMVKPFERCADFAALCDTVLKRFNRHGGPPAPTLPFQALRIAVNGELDELETALDAAAELLNPGGRLCIISFQSMEDRIVKRYLQDMAETCKCPPGCPVCVCGWKPRFRIMTKKPVTASDEELEKNPRSACAKLRCGERTKETIQNNNKCKGETW